MLTPCAQLGNEQHLVTHTAIQHSAAGEFDDVLFSSHLESAGLEDVLCMHRLKTAAYSFQAPLVTGALLAGARDDVVEQLEHLAHLLGSCYQIIDDVLGTFGDEAQTGKPTDSDLREGKMTVLIALAEAIEPTAVQGWRDGELSNDAMRALFVTHDLETQARQLAEECCHQARVQLAALPVRAHVRTTFRRLIDDLLQGPTNETPHRTAPIYHRGSFQFRQNHRVFDVVRPGLPVFENWPGATLATCMRWCAWPMKLSTA